ACRGSDWGASGVRPRACDGICRATLPCVPPTDRPYFNGLDDYSPIADADKRKNYRKRGKSQTVRVLGANSVNVNDPKTGTTVSATISTVIENGADPNYVRRNIITKGAIVDTDKGRVRITSRPGMHGVVSGILLED
ncbi:MAG: 30S ribosomal protein S8e, partial [Candidatus Thermoplasmatota archaeon]|nr:30S ribosomal protein S8e [Candidatus Thermoplasmatota archaeon]